MQESTAMNNAQGKRTSKHDHIDRKNVKASTTTALTITVYPLQFVCLHLYVEVLGKCRGNVSDSEWSDTVDKFDVSKKVMVTIWKVISRKYGRYPKMLLFCFIEHQMRCCAECDRWSDRFNIFFTKIKWYKPFFRHRRYKCIRPLSWCCFCYYFTS